jgi:hypothetical protein
VRFAWFALRTDVTAHAAQYLTIMGISLFGSFLRPLVGFVVIGAW